MACRGAGGCAGVQRLGTAGAEPEAPKVGHHVADATRALLKAQREGTYAGEPAPLRGDVAVLGYQRYLDSFTQPMPGLTQTQSGTRASTVNFVQQSGR